MTKCVITGGHFTPGLAIIEELSTRGWDISWIGIEQAVTGTKAKTLEAQILPNLKVPFYGIRSAKLHRTNLIKSLLDSWEFFLGFYQSFVILQKIKPHVVLSFGSYVSVPVSFAAWILGIPVITHEQTVTSGLANQMVGFMAEKIAISFSSSKDLFPESKTVLLGNLVRKKIHEIAKKRKNKKVGNPPLLFITGGSRGSVILNKAVTGNLGELLKKFTIIHQSGELDFNSVKKAKEKLPPKLKARYKIGPTFTPLEFEKIFEKADVMLSRAGANTVSEIAILGIPTIFVPISWSSSNEQYKNAKMLKDLGSAEIIEESEITSKTLLSTLEKMLKDYGAYKKNSVKAQKLIPQTASKKLADILDKYAHQ